MDDGKKTGMRRTRKKPVRSDQVLEELARLAFANPAEVFDLEQGIVREGVNMQDAAAIASVKVKVSKTSGGETVEREFKMLDKLKSLELLGRCLGVLGGAAPPDKGTAAPVVLRDDVESDQ